MRVWQKSILKNILFVSSIISSFSLFAASEQLQQLSKNEFKQTFNVQNGTVIRQQYQDIMQLLSGEVSETTITFVRQMLPTIAQYPLAPYVDYRLFNKQSLITPQQLKLFIQQNPNFLLNDNLIDLFYKKAFQQQAWQLLLDNKTSFPAKTTAQQCIQLLATQKTSNISKELDLLWQDTEKLWLSGENLPSQCDQLFQLWQQSGKLSDQLILQRAELTLKSQNKNLIRYLQRLTNNIDLQKQLQQWADLISNPQQLIVMQSNLPHSTTNKQLLLEIYPRYLSFFSEQSLNLSQIQQQIEDLQKNWQLTAQELNLLYKAVLQRFFDNKQPEWQQWRDQKLMQLKDNSLIERRIRLAIRQQQPLQNWLDQLSADTINQDEWQYWRAWQLQKKGKQQEAEKIWQNLSRKRGFYALLSAQTLNIDYQPVMQDLPQPINFDDLWQDQEITTILSRVIELRNFRYLDDAYSEWLFLLNLATAQQQLLLAEYALQQQWYDLTVAATIKAKAWDYLRLRLPLAYLDWFSINMADKTISNSFAMAIARQESAWRPNVRSSANAIGLMQLLPSTAKATAQQANYSIQRANNLTDPLGNILLGTAHLQQLAQKYGNNRLLIAAAYNAGANRVDRWLNENEGKLSMAEFIASIPFYETRNYVQNVVSYDYYYQLLLKQELKKFSKTETDRLY
ncbi:lytic murein transglycosylase [Gallibacterium genomosp. 2]|uniref:Lytic murein transglycosylase n=2 Tax=Gallibacterium TaxID=155493 RepID=A0A0A2XFF3_9PAST|nr:MULTISPECIES: transglycosylase SLT domain-containing protein [Gallibacterium]KGQ30888.1 lytic murein transglycosylase [Gallibacterium genomosp. 2]KGQ36864.1 lytic murein transglycosylase [Gallibacterium genomosp. 1]